MQVIGEEDPDLHVAVAGEDAGIVRPIVAQQIAAQDDGGVPQGFGCHREGIGQLADHPGVARALAGEHQHQLPAHGTASSRCAYSSEMPSAKVLPRSTISTCPFMASNRPLHSAKAASATSSTVMNHSSRTKRRRK